MGGKPGLLLYCAAGGAGAIAGLAFAVLWPRLMRPGTSRRFWSTLHGLARQIVAVDDFGNFVRLYGSLARLLGAYLLRSLGGTLVACLPMVFILLALWPFLRDREVVFFGSFAAVTLIGLVWPLRRRS
jgi:hypothetical protein